MSANKITADIIGSWRVRGDGIHYNGGSSKIINGLIAVENPRLSKIQTMYRGAEATRREKRGEPTLVEIYKVDGQPCDSMEDAAERLNHPVVLTEKEQWLLDKLTDELVPMKAKLAEWAGIAEGEAPTCINDHEEYKALWDAMYGLDAKNMLGRGRLPCPPNEFLEELTGRKHRTIPAICRKAAS